MQFATTGQILGQGAGTGRQLAIFNQTQNYKDVVDYIHSQYLA
jgi:hypothetical protein